MARTVDDLALFFRSLDPQRMSALDPRVPPLAWEVPEAVKLEGLSVGFYDDDGVLPASRAIARAVARATEALKSRGCRVSPFRLPAVRPMVSAYLGALSADDGDAMFEALAGGEIDPVLKPMKRIAALPLAVRRGVAAAAVVFRQPNLGLMLGAMGAKTAAELWELTARLRAYRTELLDAMDRAKVDVLLCPPVATPALPHRGSTNFTLASSYGFVFNGTQFPAGVVPVTRVREDETARRPSRDAIERRAARVDARSNGLPVGVQVAARPWKDHVALAVMRAIETEVSRDLDYPKTPIDPREGD
jgi:fatty acid amide hydrolase